MASGLTGGLPEASNLGGEHDCNKITKPDFFVRRMAGGERAAWGDPSGTSGLEMGLGARGRGARVACKGARPDD